MSERWSQHSVLLVEEACGRDKQVARVIIMNKIRGSYIAIVLVCWAVAVASVNPPNNCCYQFAAPTLPSFTLPDAQPTSPGDITLNVNNPITLYNGQALEQGCNGNSLQYFDVASNAWQSDYIDANGATRNTIDLFYATGSNVNIRTIQTWQQPLARLLQNRTVQLSVQCNNGQQSCISFKIGDVVGVSDSADAYCQNAPVATTCRG